MCHSRGGGNPAKMCSEAAAIKTNLNRYAPLVALDPRLRGDDIGGQN